ncbi:MAG TPA: HAD family hydrolase, partial [Candidatus Binataceae bacterium]|nr:HAD family hydrolase [Candidatus Binataceae bacterium]
MERWTVFDSGGHFAPMEEPAKLIEDIRAFFRPLRQDALAHLARQHPTARQHHHRAASGDGRPRSRAIARAGHPLHLVFDADDTLWDSNIHFLEAEAEFVAAMAAAGAGASETVRGAIRRREVEIVSSHGYGREPYVMLMRQVAAEIAPADAREVLETAVERLGARFLERPCELLPGVAPTLAELATRHRLALFTKGRPHEQLRKLERSGLRRHFSHVEVPPEKDESAYRRLVAAAALDPARTFMIGNSPRSDINPALRAGLRAVFIPHPHTWELEHEEVDLADERVTVLANFRALLEIF